MRREEYILSDELKALMRTNMESGIDNRGILVELITTHKVVPCSERSFPDAIIDEYVISKKPGNIKAGIKVFDCHLKGGIVIESK